MDKTVYTFRKKKNLLCILTFFENEKMSINIGNNNLHMMNSIGKYL